MGEASIQSEQDRQPVLEYATPVNNNGTTLLGRGAFTAGLLSVVAVVLFWITAEDSFQTVMLLVAIGGALAGVFIGILGRRDENAGAARVESRNGIILASAAVALLLARTVLFPPFVCNLPRERPNRVKCQSNLRLIGQGLFLYAHDHGGQYPTRLGQLITDADLNPEVFVCWSSNDQAATGTTTQQTAANLSKKGCCSYIYLAAGMAGSSIPANFVVAYEPLDHHENDGANFLFGDGHTEWLSAKEAAKFVKQLKAGVNPPK